jgi:hypothetical protein
VRRFNSNLNKPNLKPGIVNTEGQGHCTESVYFNKVIDSCVVLHGIDGSQYNFVVFIECSVHQIKSSIINARFFLKRLHGPETHRTRFFCF